MQALPFAFLAIIFYLGAGLWQGLTLTRRVPARTRLVRSLALIAVACHAVIVWVTLNHGGALHLGLFESASLVSWAICLLLVIASLFKPVIAGGAALFPVAAACDGAHGASHGYVPELTGSWRAPADRQLSPSWQL